MSSSWLRTTWPVSGSESQQKSLSKFFKFGRCAACVCKWTSNCALSTNSKTFLQKLEENNKIALQTTINSPALVSLCLQAKLTVWGLDVIKTRQSPHQFPAERRPLQKSSGGGGLILCRRLQKISNFSACLTQDTQHKIKSAFSFVERNNT